MMESNDGKPERKVGKLKAAGSSKDEQAGDRELVLPLQKEEVDYYDAVVPSNKNSSGSRMAIEQRSRFIPSHVATMRERRKLNNNNVKFAAAGTSAPQRSTTTVSRTAASLTDTSPSSSTTKQNQSEGLAKEKQRIGIIPSHVASMRERRKLARSKSQEERREEEPLPTPELVFSLPKKAGLRRAPPTQRERRKAGAGGKTKGPRRTSSAAAEPTTERVFGVRRATTTGSTTAAAIIPSHVASLRERRKVARSRSQEEPPPAPQRAFSLPKKAGLRRAPPPRQLHTHHSASAAVDEEDDDEEKQALLSNDVPSSSFPVVEEEKQEEEYADDEYQQPKSDRSFGSLPLTTKPVEAILVEEDDSDNNKQRMEEEIRNKIFQEAVIGEAIAVDSTKEEEDHYYKNPFLMMMIGRNPKRRKRVFVGCVSLLILFVVVVVVVALVIGLSLTWTKDNNKQNNKTQQPSSSEWILPISYPTTQQPSLFPTTRQPTLSPSVSNQPTAFPTISNGPSISPSVSNQPTAFPTISNGPSISPSVSSQPTFFPTISNENRNNTNRDEAQFLELRSPPLKAYISSFAEQTVKFSCRRRRRARQQRSYGGRDLAATFKDGIKALWYTYTPEISGPVSVIMCGGNPVVNLEVFENDPSECFYDPVFQGVFASNGDMGSCGGTSFSWEAHQGHKYTIFLYLGSKLDYSSQSFWWRASDNAKKIGSRSSNNNTNEGGQGSNIFMQQQQQQPDEEFITVQVVDNDLCEYAFGPVSPTSAGVVLSYNTLEATVDNGGQALNVSCGGSTAPTAPGVWYTVNGTGQPITASTCTADDENDDDPLAMLDTQISVFRGDDCHSLVCINGNDDACGQQSSVTWASLSGEIYYLLVHGPSSSTLNSTLGTSISGRYNLTLSTDLYRLINDLCGSAKEIQQGNLTNNVEYTFAGSTADQDIPCLEAESIIPYGIWYVFEGTGDPLKIEHYVAEDEHIRVIVFSGTCGALSCVGTTTDDGGATWGSFWQGCFPTNVGETYYIYVYTTLLNALDETRKLELGTCSL